MLTLSGKTALVCGASQGIGAACAKLLAMAECQVILLSRRKNALEEVKNSLPTPMRHLTIAVDISDKSNLISAITEIQEQTGPIHICINNTQGPKGGPLAQATEDEFIHAFNNHVLVNASLAKCLIPGMKKSGYGRFINIISTSVKIPIPGLGVSNTVRGAVASFAKTLAFELAPFGITVNNVLPGFTETPRLSSLIESKAHQEQLSVESISKAWQATVPMGRFAKPEEIASLVVFLASPLASYITGTSIPVDGGRTGSL